MQHLVRYTMSSGQHEYHEADSLESALTLVERARNDYGATDAKVFREVKIEFRVHYKVEVADDGAPQSAAPVAPATAVDAAPPVQAAAEPTQPPPGAMPLTAKPSPGVEEAVVSTDVAMAAVEGGDHENVTALNAEGTSRRTLFGRSS